VIVPVTRRDIDAAATRIGRHVRRTPVIDVEAGTFGDHALVLKLELLQHAGSFKPRGAFNRVLLADVPAVGLVAASGGNHGVAVAHVAQALGHRAEVFVPATSPAAKVERIRALGATVAVGGAIYDDAQAAATARAEETGAVLVHPYDHADIVAGQGTVGRELDEQAPELDTVLVAVGGGGLIAGVASWFAGAVRVVSVEPTTIPAMHAALAAGHPVEVSVSGLAADSLGATRVGAVPFACAAPVVADAVLVDDEAIRAAQRALWRSLRVMAEPGGAAALAAVLSGAYVPGAGERVAVVVCGGNVDPAQVMA
jgi:threonine dehydratase